MAQIVRVLKQQATGAAAIAATFSVPSPGMNLRLVSITVHFSADPGAENLTVTLDANAGAVYDTILLTQAMSGVTNLLWFPDGEVLLEPGDAIKVAQANAGTKTYGVQATFKEVT